MKKLILILFSIATFGIYSETEVGGVGKISTTAFIPEDDYDSPVNPNNIYQLRDFTMSPSLSFDITNYDEVSNFEVKFTLGSYPIAQLLMSPNMDPALKETMDYIFTETGDRINTFNLERLFIDINIMGNLIFSVGRKPYLTGFGYGWNPTDTINPLKNPEDPEAELKGVDTLSLEGDFGLTTARATLIIDKSLYIDGIDYEKLALNSEINVYLGSLDIILSGYYTFNNERAEKVNALSLGFKQDLMGIGIYGEGVILDGSRNLFVIDGVPQFKDDLLFNILGGIEYTFKTDTTTILEYYYNGEGYNSKERDNYKVYLNSTGGMIPLHRSGNYTRHYILGNITQPIYDLNSSASVSGIFSLDSYSLMISPEYIISFSDNADIKISYSGLFDFGGEFTETELSPVTNIFNLTLEYAY